MQMCAALSEEVTNGMVCYLCHAEYVKLSLWIKSWLKKGFSLQQKKE